MTTPDQPQPQSAGAATPSPLADWGTRAVGAIIDWLPVFILGILLSWNGFLRSLSGLVSIAYWAYIGHLEGVTGQTPGKAIMGTRLVNTQGELIGSGAGIGRKFAHIVDAIVCMLGFLLPLVDAKRQTIADKLLVTYVVTGAEKKPFAVELWMSPNQGTSPPSAPPPEEPPQSQPPEGHSPQS
jgi:uncharacterized RDD family membrane protein YckC